MAYPDKINALVDVTGDQTLAAGGHAARHNDVNEALEEVRDALGGGTPITATDNFVIDARRDGYIGLSLTRQTDDTSPPVLRLMHSRGNAASPSVVQDGDRLGQIEFRGYSGAATAYHVGARIVGEVDGTPDTSGDTTDMPGRLTFDTRLDGSSAATERMRINNAGAVLIGTTSPGSAGAGDLVVDGGVFLGGTAAANELNDYEEGTWTPTYTTTSTDFTSVTYDATTAGSYVKIGEMVYVTGWLRTDAITSGSASGDVVIGGLPYAPTNLAGNSNRPSVCIGYADAFSAEAPISGQVVESESFIRLYYRSTSDGSSLALQVADLGTGSNDNDLLFSTFYRV